MLEIFTSASTSPGPLAAFRRLFVPVDLSPPSHRAVELALALQRSMGSTVCVFTVAEYGENDNFLRGLGDLETPGDLVRFAEERLRRFVDNIEPGASDRVATRASVEGDVVRAVTEEARLWRATLVIVARASTRPTIFRSDEERLLRLLEVPVLILDGPRPGVAPGDTFRALKSRE